MCSQNKGSDIQGCWRRGSECRIKWGCHGIGTRLDQPVIDGSLVDSQHFALDDLKCIGILGGSVSKVEAVQWLMEANNVVVICTLTSNNQHITTHALINCSAIGIGFMDQACTCHDQIPSKQLREKWQVDIINRSCIEIGDNTHITKVGMEIQDHNEQLPMFVITLGYYSIVPGIGWLQQHNFAVCVALNSLTFRLLYFITHCHNAPVTAQGVREKPLEPVYPINRKVFEPKIQPQRPFR